MYEVPAEQVLSWELNVYDTQKGAFWGAQQEFYADSQLDNLASCHAGLTALLDETVLQTGNTVVCAFFDMPPSACRRHLIPRTKPAQQEPGTDSLVIH
jgi:aspartyl aminopeptidase